jgi:hypothetical protein
MGQFEEPRMLAEGKTGVKFRKRPRIGGISCVRPAQGRYFGRRVNLVPGLKSRAIVGSSLRDSGIAAGIPSGFSKVH